jgi:predicted nucleic acid-binding protein
MILLDTNVISALMRDAADRTVVSWLDRQAPETTWTTSISVYEVELGLAIMSQGRRRRALAEAFALVLNEDIGGRVAVFDRAAAKAAAGLAARRQQAGRPVDTHDTQIAGIAMSRRATIVTRNVRHFLGVDVPVIDPWEAA